MWITSGVEGARGDHGQMNERLLTPAQARGMVFTAADAERFDVSRRDLLAACRRGEVHRVRRGAYVLAEACRAASPEERLALQTRAVLAARGGGIASHHSALALHGLPMVDAGERIVDLIDDVARVRLESGVRIHPPTRLGLPPGMTTRELTTGLVRGYRCLPIAVAIALAASRDGVLSGLVPLDRALHDQRCSVADVADVFGLVPFNRRERQRGAELIRLADSASESVGETRTRVVLSDLGFRFRSQVKIRDENGVLVARVDFLVGERVVVEFDGAIKYEGCEGRAALMAEKRREDRLRSLGYEVVRLTWSDLAYPQRVAALVRQAQARVRAA